ncbi:MAG: undecaprenyl-phosphate glucose phosphotransferase [Rhodoferax sp.]|nr:undecaprenyl-phosphate glucose phosphotransferase [Rhodoferax sp.]
MVRSPIRLSSPFMRYAARLLDLLLIWLCAELIYLLQFGTGLAMQYALVMTVATLIWVLTGGSVYRSWRFNKLGNLLGSVISAWLLVVLAVVLWLFLSKSSSSISRLWFVSWAAGTLAAMCLVRVFVFAVLHVLRKVGYNYKTVLLVGASPACGLVQKLLSESGWTGLQVQAEVTTDALAAFLAVPGQKPSNEVWLCLSLADQAGIENALYALRHSTANIRLVPDWYSLKLINHGISQVLGISMLDISASPITGATRLIKAAQDRVGALVILLVIALPMVAIALLIKFTSKGPVLFKQWRHGWNGEPILVYKFRTMVVHDESDFQVTQATRGDTRITPLGAFLRCTSLDELPQFINVLQGRMSIVGPRPHAMQHNEYYKELVPGYMLRHKVKPGITGWAQINGYRGGTNTLDKMQKRVEYDLYYVEHLSLWFDLKIIFLTIFKGWVHKNAY